MGTVTLRGKEFSALPSPIRLKKKMLNHYQLTEPLILTFAMY